MSITPSCWVCPLLSGINFGNVCNAKNYRILLRFPRKESPIFERRIDPRHVMPDLIRHPVTTLAKTPCLPMACFATGCRIKSGMTMSGALSKAAMATWQTSSKTFRTAVRADWNDVLGRDALRKNSSRFRSNLPPKPPQAAFVFDCCKNS
ncbi:hypothetical protein [Lampropedia hyalina]|jgi:hypothetical protein|uniref:hypothetical protein n=1 Tax=Lampropedia hyalina TaxID=198706 RepID=UPI0011611C9C|nr:hypothetical protein [Lampropedia hyalina]